MTICPGASIGDFLRPADDECLLESPPDQAQLIEHFMALDEFRDGLDPYGVAPLVDGFDFLGSREAAAEVLHGAVGELYKVGPEHFEEVERALAAVEAGEGEAAA